MILIFKLWEKPNFVPKVCRRGQYQVAVSICVVDKWDKMVSEKFNVLLDVTNDPLTHIARIIEENCLNLSTSCVNADCNCI